MKRVYSRLAVFLILCALLTLSAICVSGVKGEEPRPVKLRDDDSIRVSFQIDFRPFCFRLVYNYTAKNYSLYSLGELIVGKSSITDIGDFVAENLPGPTISSEGTFSFPDDSPYKWFEIKDMGDVIIVYYNGIEALVVVPENPGASVILVLSPENKTYNTTDVPLEYKVNEYFFTTTYSLDGHAKRTIMGNTVLTGLANGTHSIVVYIETAPGNITASETIYFTVSSTDSSTNSSTDNENQIFAPKTVTPQIEAKYKAEDTSTNIKNETPDYSTKEPEITNTEEDNSNETPATQQDTNIPNTSTQVLEGLAPSGFLAAIIGTSDLFLAYSLIGVLVTAASWFLAGAKMRKHKR